MRKTKLQWDTILAWSIISSISIIYTYFLITIILTIIKNR